jgi:tetraacyldisaccharide 4'-kinase
MRRSITCSLKAMSLQSWLERRWYSAQPAPLLLRPLASAYAGIAQGRRKDNLERLAQQQRLSVPVIVVGNISIGGTGKTPFVIWLVEHLREWGFKPGIVSRGYGGHAPSYPLHVNSGTTSAQCGDEPLLLAQRLQCPLVVDPDRLAAARVLIEKYPIDVIVSDDGLQHYKLPRDLEICLVDGARGLGNGALLPAGPLREPPSRLRDVGLVVVNGGGWRGEAPQHVDMILRMSQAVSLCDPQTQKSLADFAGQRVHAIAGIGNPARFFSQLESCGIDVIAHAFPDHHVYSASDIRFGDDAPVLMTEKDAVKCRGFAQARHWYVPVNAELGAADSALVRKLCEVLER